jgi:Peptidase M50B-like
VNTNICNNSFSYNREYKNLENTGCLQEEEIPTESFLNEEGLKTSLIEAIAYAAIMLIAMPFLAPEEQMTALTFTAVAFATSVILRQLEGTITTQLKKMKIVDPSSAESRLLTLINIFALFLLSIPSQYVKTVVHEHGHYLAIKSVDFNSEPNISLFANFSGDIAYDSNPAMKMNKALIASGGPVADVLAASVLIAAGHYQKAKTNLGLFFNMQSILTIFQALSYANSSFSNPAKSSHDYAVMWKKGDIHPYLSMIGIVALPLLTKGGLMLYDRYAETGEIPILPALNDKLCKFVKDVFDEDKK